MVVDYNTSVMATTLMCRPVGSDCTVFGVFEIHWVFTPKMPSVRFLYMLQ